MPSSRRPSINSQFTRVGCEREHELDAENGIWNNANATFNRSCWSITRCSRTREPRPAPPRHMSGVTRTARQPRSSMRCKSSKRCKRVERRLTPIGRRRHCHRQLCRRLLRSHSHLHLRRCRQPHCQCRLHPRMWRSSASRHAQSCPSCPQSRGSRLRRSARASLRRLTKCWLRTTGSPSHASAFPLLRAVRRGACTRGSTLVCSRSSRRGQAMSCDGPRTFLDRAPG